MKKRNDIPQLRVYQHTKPLLAIVTKFHEMTATSKRTRVSARCAADRIFLPWDHNMSKDDNFRAAAQALCAKLRWHGPLVHGMLDDGSHVFVQVPEIEDKPTVPELFSASDLRDFSVYLSNCTDTQINGVYEKERAAGRTMYVILAEQEAQRRNIKL